MVDIPNLKQMEELFQRHAECELAGDIEGTLETLTADAYYELVTVGFRVEGFDALREKYRRTFDGYNKRVVSSTARVFTAGPQALCREGYNILETDSGRVQYRSIAVIEFDGGLISSERIYGDSDNAAFMRSVLGADFCEVPGVSAISPDLNVPVPGTRLS